MSLLYIKHNTRCYTHIVDVEGHWAILHGEYGGLTASQRTFQCVVGGIDCCFAFRVLEGEAGISKSVRLRKHQKMTTLDKDQKCFSFINSFSEL